MSIKYFCDCCGDEIDGGNVLGGSRLSGTVSAASGHKLSFEIMHSLDGVWNTGNWCKYCIIDAVQSKDDRPRPAK